MNPHPHDALFRAVFSQPENIVGELQTVLPSALSARIDWSTLRHEPGSFVDKKLQDLRTDLLFSVNFRDAPERRAFLYALVEHQTDPERFMALRLLGYQVRVWEDFLEKNPKAEYLPVIIPVVVHPGKGRWRLPTRFSKTWDLDPADHAELAPFLADFEFILDDLARVTNVSLRDREKLNAFGRVVLLFLKHAHNAERLLESFRLFDALFRELLRSPSALADFGLLLRYYASIHQGSLEPLRKALVEAAGPKVDEVVMTIAEALRNEGRAAGLADGKSEGKAEAILGVLVARGIAVSAEVRSQILACKDLPRLDRWIARAVTVSSAAELLEA